MLYNGFYSINECSGRAMENLTASGSTVVIFFASGQAVLIPQGHFPFFSFKSGMGTDFSLWTECSGRDKENLTTSGYFHAMMTIF
jgi:hypothetical protein